jgi:hypothetical protein
MCLQKISKSLRKLAQKLSCMATPWEPRSKPSVFSEHNFDFSKDICGLFGPCDRVHLRRAYTTTPP